MVSQGRDSSAGVKRVAVAGSVAVPGWGRVVSPGRRSRAWVPWGALAGSVVLLVVRVLWRDRLL